MNYTTQELIAFVATECGWRRPITGSTDVFNDLGCCGDDLSQLLETYAKKFTVDMTDYIWYFHNEDEGSGRSFGSLFFKPPYDRVKRIPITIDMLTEFANAGRWSIDYPEHDVPVYRYDILINQLFFGLLFLIITVIALYGYFSR